MLPQVALLIGAHSVDERGTDYYIMPPIPPYRFWLVGDRLRNLQEHLDSHPGMPPAEVLKGEDFLEYCRLRGKADLFWFAKYPCGFTWLRWPLHGPIAYAWQAENGTQWIDQLGRVHVYDRFRAAVIPRGHLKTSLLTQAYGMWRVVNCPEERILIYTMHYDFATIIMNYIRETFEGGGFHGAFFNQLYGSIIPPPAMRGKEVKWGSNDLTILREGAYSDPTFKARGIGSRVTGGHHTVQLIDDLVGEELNKTQMLKVLRDFDNLDPLYHSLALGERRFVGTPWAFFDPISNIAKYWPEAIVTRLNWLNEKGEMIFPPIPGRPELGGCDVPKVEALFKRNAWFASCQYNCWPKAEGKIGFQRSWFKYFRQRGDYIYPLDTDGQETKRIAIADCNTFILIDPNTGREEGGNAFNADANMPVASSHDFAAWVVVCVDRDNRWFIPRVLRWRCNIDEFVDKTFEIVDVWKPRKVCIEQRAAQILFVKIFRDAFKMGKPPFVIDDWKGGNATKPARIKALIPYYSNGTIYHRDSADPGVAKHIEDLEGELLDFPTPDHDDASDALSAAVQKVYAPGKDAPTFAETKKDFIIEAQMASLDKASRRAARAWINRSTKRAPDEWFSEGNECESGL